MSRNSEKRAAFNIQGSATCGLHLVSIRILAPENDTLLWCTASQTVCSPHITGVNNAAHTAQIQPWAMWSARTPRMHLAEQAKPELPTSNQSHLEYSTPAEQTTQYCLPMPCHKATVAAQTAWSYEPHQLAEQWRSKGPTAALLVMAYAIHCIKRLCRSYKRPDC